MKYVAIPAIITASTLAIIALYGAKVSTATIATIVRNIAVQAIRLCVPMARATNAKTNNAPNDNSACIDATIKVITPVTKLIAAMNVSPKIIIYETSLKIKSFIVTAASP